ncbi:MAG: biofilm regulation protein phosphatase SiaA [Marinobacter sp.]|nr:biofilm regulation protein phosphatase SiaA [Marinobacter sp.]
MSQWAIGLRNKAILALALACIVALIPATAIGWKVITSVQDYFGQAFARNLTELSRQQILSPVLQDLTLARRLAGSVVTREWLQDEESQPLADRFFREAEGFQQDFRSQAYFIISARSHKYYFNQATDPFSDAPRYSLNPETDSDAWFFRLIKTIGDFNINVNPDAQLGTTRVWINVPVLENGELLGLAGTGLDLTRFIDDFVASGERGVTPIIVNSDGAIQAHPDRSRIAFGSGAGLAQDGRNLFNHVTELQHDALRTAMSDSVAAPGTVTLLNVTLDGEPQLLAMTYIAELGWHLVTAIDLSVAQVIGGQWWITVAMGVLLTMLLLLAAMAIAVERILIRPLNRLQGSATAISKGNYNVRLPQETGDEIGDLTRAFAAMIQKVQSHTVELESKVHDRTRDLENSNREIALFNKMVNDSIDYASLIQRAILPDAALRRDLGDRYFVCWQPRDTVGGDFYFYHSEDNRHLLGLVDCAGHGVPGALMTMLARAAFDHAIREEGLVSPAALLHNADQTLRTMLQDLDLPRALATNMDAGLVVLDESNNTLTFAGAKVSLFIADGDQTSEIKGGKRALVARRQGTYEDHPLTPQPGQHFYLTSDGYLDQAGGEHGYGMGSSGFQAALREARAVPVSQQGRQLLHYLRDYQGDFPQRDDICLLGFRFPA